MKWYLRFWFHNWRARVYQKRVRSARAEMLLMESRLAHHQGEWQLMKQALKDFK